MKPILVVQMQRMGDLILTWPLLLWLQRAWPGHPVWVLAERQFAVPLGKLSPAVRYVFREQMDSLQQQKFHLVINLSHRPEARQLAGSLQSEALIGSYTRDGITRVNGNWQEYRESLVHNNRHNRFHWADLSAMDVIPQDVMTGTQWQTPRVQPADVRRIGLFLGASEEHKRPAPAFWAGLVHELERRKWIPVLLGGPGDTTLCRKVQKLAKRPVASACGRLGLDQFAHFGQELAAMITPDTGPMHLAAWTGLVTLNLSMGSVHAWETGPYQPGHVILRSNRDCVGCWQCRFDRPLCHDGFEPLRVVRVLETMLRRGKALGSLRLPGLQIHGSGRSQGLYHLVPLSASTTATTLLGAYWQQFWLHAFGRGSEDACRAAARQLGEMYPLSVRSMSRQALKLFRSLTSSQSAGDATAQCVKVAPCLRSLSGFAATHLSNNDYSPASRKKLRSLTEHLLSNLADW